LLGSSITHPPKVAVTPGISGTSSTTVTLDGRKRLPLSPTKMAKWELTNLLEQEEKLIEQWKSGAMDTDSYEVERADVEKQKAECKRVLNKWF
jgi:hypothetical protein